MYRVECCPGHTATIFDATTMPDVVRWADMILRRERVEAIVVCGHSGLLLAGALQYLNGIPVFAVRKPGEQGVATGGRMVSGIAPNGPVKRWAWVDDFLSGGGTFRRARSEVWSAGLVTTLDPVCVLSYGRFVEDIQVGVSDNDSMSMNKNYTVPDNYPPLEGWSYYPQYGYRR